MVALGLVLLGLILIKPFGKLRRFHAAQKQVAAGFGDRNGLLKARVAGLKVAFAERWHRTTD